MTAEQDMICWGVLATDTLTTNPFPLEMMIVLYYLFLQLYFACDLVLCPHEALWYSVNRVEPRTAVINKTNGQPLKCQKKKKTHRHIQHVKQTEENNSVQFVLPQKLCFCSAFYLTIELTVLQRCCSVLNESSQIMRLPKIHTPVS